MTSSCIFIYAHTCIARIVVFARYCGASLSECNIASLLHEKFHHAGGQYHDVMGVAKTNQANNFMLHGKCHAMESSLTFPGCPTRSLNRAGWTINSAVWFPSAIYFLDHRGSPKLINYHKHNFCYNRLFFLWISRGNCSPGSHNATDCNLLALQLISINAHVT